MFEDPKITEEQIVHQLLRQGKITVCDAVKFMCGEITLRQLAEECNLINPSKE
jgi:hypothetical protein